MMLFIWSSRTDKTNLCLKNQMVYFMEEIGGNNREGPGGGLLGTGNVLFLDLDNSYKLCSFCNNSLDFML